MIEYDNLVLATLSDSASVCCAWGFQLQQITNACMYLLWFSKPEVRLPYDL